jgi:hypothetical protein
LAVADHEIEAALSVHIEKTGHGAGHRVHVRKALAVIFVSWSQEALNAAISCAYYEVRQAVPVNVGEHGRGMVSHVDRVIQKVNEAVGQLLAKPPGRPENLSPEGGVEFAIPTGWFVLHEFASGGIVANGKVLPGPQADFAGEGVFFGPCRDAQAKGERKEDEKWEDSFHRCSR